MLRRSYCLAVAKHSNHRRHHINIVSSANAVTLATQNQQQQQTQVTRHFDAQARRWILVELRHGVYKRFAVPEKLWNFSSSSPARSSSSSLSLHLGDLVLCRVASMYQTGIIHGASTLPRKFLLPFSFSHESKPPVDSSGIRKVSALAFPRTGGEIIGVISQPPSSLSSLSSICDGGIEQHDDQDQENPPPLSSSSLKQQLEFQSRAEHQLLQLCREQLLQHEIRSVRVVAATTDLFVRSFVHFFYVETDASTPLDSFKEHMSRLLSDKKVMSKLLPFLSANDVDENDSSNNSSHKFRVWMSNCYRAGPHELRGPWPAHLAWPTPARHRGACNLIEDSILQHLLRCVTTYPTVFTKQSAAAKGLSNIALSLSSKSSSSAVALTCSLACGEWIAALKALTQQEAVSSSGRLREVVALRIAAEQFAPPSQRSVFRDAVQLANPSSVERDVLELVRSCCLEYTSTDARVQQQHHQLLDDGGSQQQHALVKHIGNNSSNNANSVLQHHETSDIVTVVNYHEVAQRAGLWRTLDPRQDHTALKKFLDDQKGQEIEQQQQQHQRQLLKTVNAPYVSKYTPAKFALSADVISQEQQQTADLMLVGETEDAAKKHRRILERATAQRKLVFHHALAVAADACSSSHQSTSTCSFELRQLYLANFHSEFPPTVLRNWLRLACGSKRTSGEEPSSSAWSAALQVAFAAIRNIKHDDDSNVKANLIRDADAILQQHADQQHVNVQRMRAALAKLLLEQQKRQAPAVKNNNQVDEDDDVMPCLVDLLEDETEVQATDSDDDEDAEFEAAMQPSEVDEQRRRQQQQQQLGLLSESALAHVGAIQLLFEEEA